MPHRPTATLAALALALAVLPAPLRAEDSPCKNFSSFTIDTVPKPFQVRLAAETVEQAGASPCVVQRGSMTVVHPRGISPLVTWKDVTRGGKTITRITIDWNLQSVPPDEADLEAGSLGFRIPKNFSVHLESER